MNDYKQQMATEFERYQSLTTDVQREAFWNGIAKQSESMPVEQRLLFQQAIREQTDQLLRRIESIADLLTSPQNSVAA